eukprot:GHVS01101108.1.p1 GENE.GHVS01101108.1~~GHVS01101108.1.p1  ORF type:complete len:118 (+),score=4.59 GHVS01101108.1:598-951(+)
MKIFRIILLAIIAASGGHFVEALDMCKTKDDCPLFPHVCRFTFFIATDGQPAPFELTRCGFGVCGNNVNALSGFYTGEEKRVRSEFIEACKEFQVSCSERSRTRVNEQLVKIEKLGR